MFKVAYRDLADVEPFLHLPVTAEETYSIGEGLVLTGGTLTKVGATAKPSYIAQADKADADGNLLVIPVLPTTHFETTSTATVASELVGSKVTLHTDGLTVTATTTSGVFTIDKTDGAATNSIVVGHFE